MELKKPPKEFYLYNCIHTTFLYPGLQEQVNDPCFGYYGTKLSRDTF